MSHIEHRDAPPVHFAESQVKVFIIDLRLYEWGTFQTSPSFSLSYNYTVILRLNRRISPLLFCKSLIIVAQVEM